MRVLGVLLPRSRRSVRASFQAFRASVGFLLLFSFSGIAIWSFALLFELKAFCALAVLLLNSSFVERDSDCLLIELDLEAFRASSGFVSVLSVGDFLFSKSDY